MATNLYDAVYQALSKLAIENIFKALVVNNVTSTDTDLPLSANQGKVLKDLLDGKQETLGFTPEDSANKGIANGYAQLDSNAKLPTSIIPDAILGQLEYQGVWDFSGGIPTATEKGQFWIASIAGNGYDIGDWAVYNGSTFDKVDNTDAVMSVNGQLGNVFIEAITHAATSKATPVDADELPMVDSAASYGLKKLTWANIKATLVATANSWAAQQTFKDVKETEYILTGSDVDPANGTRQYKTTTSAETITGNNFENGQSVTLRLSAATSVSFTGFTWVSSDGNAPTVVGKNDTYILSKENGTKYVYYAGGTL